MAISTLELIAVAMDEHRQLMHLEPRERLVVAAVMVALAIDAFPDEQQDSIYASIRKEVLEAIRAAARQGVRP